MLNIRLLLVMAISSSLVNKVVTRGLPESETQKRSWSPEWETGMNQGQGWGPGMNPGQGWGQGMNPGQGWGQGMNPGQGWGQGMNPGQGWGPGMNPGQGWGQGMGPGQGWGPGWKPGMHVGPNGWMGPHGWQGTNPNDEESTTTNTIKKNHVHSSNERVISETSTSKNNTKETY